MALDVKITKILLVGNNIVFENAANVIVKIIPCYGSHIHPNSCDEDSFYFNGDPSNRDRLIDTLLINAKDVVVPAPVGPTWVRNDLIKELRDNYINCSINVDAAGNLLQLLTDLLACCASIDGNTDQIEAKLDAQIALLTSLDGKDYATETTLAAILVDTTAIIAQLTTLNGKDFATETTLAAIKAQTDKLTFTGPNLNVTASVSVPPLQFVKDAVNTTVEIDTATPADNEPLPIAIFNDIGLQGTAQNPLGITIFDSQTNSRQIIDLNGAAKFGEAIILVGDVFGNNTPSPFQWDTEFIGSGASNSDLGLQRIESGIVANSEARFQSVKKARFMLSQFNIFHCGLRIDNIADLNCERRFGSFDPINPNRNGVYFAIIDGAWNVGYCKDGVETLVPQANWNGKNKDLFNSTPGLASYEIHYNAGSIFFFQGPNFIHVIKGLASPYAAEYHFKVAVEVINKNGNVNNNGIDVYALGTYRLGEERGETISRVFAANTLIKSSAGYIKNAYLSRTGSGGGNANLLVYDGLDNTGELMARIDIGSDDVKGIAVESTFSEGLYIEITGTGVKSATISYE